MTNESREPAASAKLKPWYLDRAAIVYVGQSTPQQVLDPQESNARQHALANRAVALGWPRSQVRVIDDDLGKSGQSIEGRPGSQRLLAEIALDRVGMILILEMSRLPRSCKDWHHLLGLCARFRVPLADADGVYDPTEYSDRPLLGPTGMMSEAELHVLKRRMHQVAVRVEWTGGSMRERAIRRTVQGYRHRQDWQCLSARLAELHGRGESPKAIAAALDGEGFRPPNRASRLTAAMVRRLLDETGLRGRVPRRTASCESPPSDERWLQDLARELGVSPYTRHVWRKKGWMRARQVGGRGGPWSVWASGGELDRLGALKDCPRLWSHRERLAELRVAGLRQG